MKDNFQRCLSAIYHSEGGDVDDPDDHGGRTSRGITQATYNAWCVEHNLPRNDVFRATAEQVATIYREEYWGKVGDSLPVGIDYIYFDLAVTSGPVRSAKLLQRAIQVAEDGHIGPVTRQRIAEMKPAELINRFSLVKEGFYRSLHQPKFIKGWINRTREVQKLALKMAGV